MLSRLFAFRALLRSFVSGTPFRSVVPFPFILKGTAVWPLLCVFRSSAFVVRRPRYCPCAALVAGLLLRRCRPALVTCFACVVCSCRSFVSFGHTCTRAPSGSRSC